MNSSIPIALALTTLSFPLLAQELPERGIDELRIHNLPTGAGTCIIVECPGENARPLIVDCGSLSRSVMDSDDAEEYFDLILDISGLEPNLVISHPDADHYNLLDNVLGDKTLNEVWIGGEYNSYPGWLRALIEEKADTNDIHRDIAAGWHNDGNPVSGLQCGIADTYVLTVNAGDDSGSEPNGDSLMLSVELGEFVAVFTGDAEDETEQSAMENFQGALETTVLYGSHHGAATHGSNGLPNSRKSFADTTWEIATSPDVLVYTSGDRYGHPRCNVTTQYAGSLAELDQFHWFECGVSNTRYIFQRTNRAEYDTHSNGIVTITTNGASPLTINCLRGPSKCSDEVEF